MGERDEQPDDNDPQPHEYEAETTTDIVEWAVGDWRPGRTFEEIEQVMETVREEGVDSEEGARQSATLLRETMEYAETFGIRLLCEFEDTDQISDRLASYQPDEVRTFYQHVATENAESFCNSKDEIDGSYAENLQSAFGLSEEVAEHDIFSWFKSHLRRIAHFYTSYYGIYGAKKHAQRYEVLKLDEFETEFPIELEAEDTRYVLFVPKSDGEPVPIAVDARLLANYSFGVARRVRSLSVAIASKDQDDEKRELTLIRDDLESILDEYREFRSGEPDGFVLYGNFEETEEIQRIFQSPANIQYESGELQFHVVDEDEYGPFTVHFEGASRIMGTAKQTVTIDSFEVTSRLTVDQYEELWKLHSAMEEGEVKSMGLYLSGQKAGEGLEHASIEEWLPPDEAVQFLRTDIVEREHIDLLKAMNQMYEREILSPADLTDEDLHLIRDCLDGRTTNELTGEEIRGLAEQIFDL
jgi:hypothetical protein